MMELQCDRLHTCFSDVFEEPLTSHSDKMVKTKLEQTDCY